MEKTNDKPSAPSGMVEPVVGLEVHVEIKALTFYDRFHKPNTVLTGLSG